MNHYTTGKQFWSSIAAWLFIVLTLVIKPSSAQVFPVQANITVTPPYTVYLSHYTTPDQQRVMVNVLLRDPVVNNLDVYLRFSVEGGGVKLYTNPGWKPAPLTLQSGIPLLIPASTIAEYFRPQNVIVEGMSQQELYRGGKLPEGYYQFKVEVLEYKRGVPISNVGRTGIWLLLNEPPRLVFPTANQKVKATNPQFVNFSWVPGSIASPLSAQNTMYEFTLVELQGDIDPNVAIATAPDAIRFTRATQQTSLLYGPGEPPLLPGKRYAFRVRAYNTEGYEIFKNNGYSDVRVFQFGDACLPPTLFTLKDETQNSFNIEVVMDPGCTGWQAQLRESGSETTEWSILKAETITSKTVKGLKASTTYQVQLKSLCGTVSSDFTAPQTITTKQKVNTQRSCDNSVSPFVVQQASPLKALKPKDIFLAALVSIKVTEVTSQGGGKFTGKGVASLPLFNAGLAVTFTDVSINEHMQLTAGEVVVERSNVNITLFGDNQNLPGGGAGGGTNSDSTGTSQWPEFTDTLNLNSDIDTVVMVNDSTVWVYTTGSSEPVVVNMGGNDCLLIVPANGNMDKAVVVYNGAAQPYRVGSGNNDSSSQHFAALRAWFTPTTGTQFGYDSLLIKEYSTFYNDLSVDSTMFKLPWKALAAGYTEPVAMHVRQGSDSLSYSTIKVVADGRPLAPSAGANTALQTYNLTGTRSGDEYPVLAIYSKDNKDAYVGGLWTATYQRKDFTLYLVPLPGTQVTEGTIGLLHNYLNQIYSQAVVSWNVQLITGFPGVDLGSNGLDHADNELLSAYNSEMNGVIEAFKTWKGKLNSDAAYLFLVPKADGGLQGYMPFNRSFGFVVAPADANGNVDAATLARTAAHELGHGIFSLRHTFSTKNVVTLPQGTTDNLMDYSGTTATRLNKYQWDLIHDPNRVLFAWAEEEEEGAMIGIPDIIKQIREANTRGEKTLKIVQDKCQKWAMKNFKLGNGQKLSYIHLSCSDKLEEPFPFDEGYSGNFDWSSIVNSSALYIDPSEISKVSTIGTKDNKRYVRYQFHELNMPANAIELPTLTDNVLFHFVVLEEEADKFENYLFGLKNKLISVNLLSISDDGIKDLILHEGKVNHVYNDAKGANSYYCEEHKGHAKISEGMYQCKEKEHENSNGTIGNPTIGVGHLIVGENELQKYCEKGIISSEEVEELLKEDIIYKAEKPLINAINEYVKDAKLNQCQFDALVSIVFNRGIGCETCKNYPNGIGFKKSDLWNNYIKKGVFYSDDPDENIEIKNKIINDGSILAGSNRRKDEAEMYFNCDYKSKK